MPNLDSALIAELIRESLEQGKEPYVTVSSNSMAPLLMKDDQIRIVYTRLEDLEIGDIVVLKGNHELITHRYWGQVPTPAGIKIITRGDRTQHFDPMVTAETIVGRVVARRRGSLLLELKRGWGRWLEHRLKEIASLEIWLFAAPPDKLKLEGGDQPRIAGRFKGRIQDHLWARAIRRLLLNYARLLTWAVNRIAG